MLYRFCRDRKPCGARSRSRSQNLKGRRACSCYLVFHLCPTLWDPMDCNLLGSSVHGISQARILEITGDLPDPGIEPASPVSTALADEFFTTESPGKL